MSIPYVIDASVFIASTQPSEPNYANARILLDRIAHESWQVYVPIILLAEIAATVACTTGRLSLARRQVAMIQNASHIEIVIIDNGLGLLAADLAAGQRIRGCDAIYVALAQSRNAVLITLDQEQKERAPQTVIVRTPAEELAVLPSSS